LVRRYARPFGGGKNRLRDIFNLALKYEMACWDALDAEAQRLKVPENAIPELYVESIDWARTVLSGAH